jgi:tetratricopeptide (TPR) repeat protein
MRTLTFWTRWLLTALVLVASRDATADLVPELLFVPEPLPRDGAIPQEQLVSLAAAVQLRLKGGEGAAFKDELAAQLARIDATAAAQGSWASALREDLLEAGLRHQRLAQHDAALQLLERALAITRADEGLNALSQVTILQSMAISYRALEKFQQADALMENAFGLQRRAHGTHGTELVRPLLALGDWNTRAFLERSALQRERTTLAFAGEGAWNAPLARLQQASENYSAALGILLRAGNLAHPDLLTLERKLLATHFLYAQRDAIAAEPGFYQAATRNPHPSRHLLDPNLESYDRGRESYARLLDHAVLTAPQRIAVLLEAADWELLHGRGTAAVRLYEEVYRLVSKNPPLEHEVDAQLHPAVPVVLPTWLPPAHSREQVGIAPEADLGLFGYVDVRFELTRFGKARRIHVLGTGGETSADVEHQLKQYLRRLQFRPLATGAANPVSLRYFIGH